MKCKKQDHCYTHIPVTRLLSSRYQDAFVLLVPSCCDKAETSCYRLVTSWMTVTGLLQVVSTRLMQAVSRHRLLYELVVIDLLTCYEAQTISEILEQLVASLLASSTLLLDDNNLFLVNHWEIFTRIICCPSYLINTESVPRLPQTFFTNPSKLRIYN